MKLSKPIRKGCFVALLLPVLMLAIALSLLYFPPFQRWASGQVAEYVAKETGLDVSVGGVSLRFPLDIQVENLRAARGGEEIVAVENVVANVKLLPLLRGKVEISELSIENGRVDTRDLIDAARVKGDIGRLEISDWGLEFSGGTDGNPSLVNISDIMLSDSKIGVILADSVPEDTTSSETPWRIEAVKARLRNVEFEELRSYGVKESEPILRASFDDVLLRDGVFDLKEGRLEVGKADVTANTFAYDSMEVKDIVLGADSINYHTDGSAFSAKIRRMSLKEKSGLEVRSARGSLAMADGRLKLTDGKIETGGSTIDGNIDIGLGILDGKADSSAKIVVKASLGKDDMMRFMGDMPESFRKKWPEGELKVSGEVRGTGSSLAVSGLQAELPGAFRLTASGTVDLSNLGENATNGKGQESGGIVKKADVDFNLRGENLDFISQMLPAEVRKEVKIPAGLGAKGNVKKNGNSLILSTEAGFDKGKLTAVVKTSGEAPSYDARLRASNLALRKMFPGYPLSAFTGRLEATGVGLDLASPQTWAKARADIENLSYDGYDLSGVSLDATLKDGRTRLYARSNNSLAKGDIAVEGTLGKNGFNGTVVADLKDIRGLIAKAAGQESPPNTKQPIPELQGARFNLSVNSDLKQYHRVSGTISDLALEGLNTQHQEDILVDILTDRDTTFASIRSQDFKATMCAGEDIEGLLSAWDNIYEEVSRQLQERIVSEQSLRAVLPDLSLSLESGNQNLLAELLRNEGYNLDSVKGELTSSKTAGLNGRMHAQGLEISGTRLDTLNFSVRTDSLRMTYQAQVRNNKNNPDYTFDALVDGIIREQGTIFGTRLYDEDGQLAIRLGMQATMEKDGIVFQTYGNEHTLGYRKFQANDSNYIFVDKDNRISANLSLKADDDTGILLYSNDQNTDVSQDITISLNHLDLGKITSAIPYAPDITAEMDGDFHIIKEGENLSVSTKIDLQQLEYEKNKMGNIGTELVYMPKSDGSHYIDGILTLEGEDIAQVEGTYNSDTSEGLNLQAELQRMPLSLVNGFIPDQIAGLEGHAEGTLTIQGKPTKPLVDGEIYLDSAYLVSQPYGIRLRFDNDPVAIKHSQLLFENFNIYSNNSSPLTTYGYLDFTDPANMSLNLKMQAQNFLLIDAKENPRSEAYGKAYVNYYGTIQGPVENLNVKGKIDVLATTDLTYILRDTPLTTDNQLDELVRFTDFADTTQTIVTRPIPAGLTADITVDITNGAHIIAYLNTDKSNYIDLIGGGLLRMTYNNTNNIQLTGRYTLANGQMKYSLPIIPLKTFTIQDQSSIEFTGDPANPTLNITATERVKAPVLHASGATKSTAFDCGIIITKTLNDMGLQFTLNAPEDIQLNSELMAMSKEQRAKLAVTMLTTGMYLAQGNTTNLTLNNALNSFLESQINSLTRSTLRTLDLTVGIDNTTDATGNTATNYTFKFAKRFFNNKINVAIGGKVSTSNDIQQENQTFFDNVSLQYRLDNTANKYLTIFYQNNVYDWLDGYTQEYGVGFIWRRSLHSLMQIFRKDNP